MTLPMAGSSGMQDLYLVFRATDTSEPFVGAIDWLRFEGGRTSKSKKATATTKTRPVDPAKPRTAVKPEGERKNEPAQSDKVRQLIANSDCKACHAQDKKLIGPSYDQVYAKYRGQRSKVPSIAQKIIDGGAGNWGQIPMTPHPQITKAEATAIVEYILAGKKID